MTDVHCVKSLGAGVFAEAFMMSDGGVMRLDSYGQTNPVAEHFFENVFPTLAPQVRRHFIETSPLTLVKNELQILQNGTCDIERWKQTTEPIFVQTMTYGGTRADLALMSKQDVKEMVLQLLVAVNALVENELVHKDIHCTGNVLQMSNNGQTVYVLCDYQYLSRFDQLEQNDICTDILNTLMFCCYGIHTKHKRDGHYVQYITWNRSYNDVIERLAQKHGLETGRFLRIIRLWMEHNDELNRELATTGYSVEPIDRDDFIAPYETILHCFRMVYGSDGSKESLLKTISYISQALSLQ